jgi:hypothetical protein
MRSPCIRPAAQAAGILLALLVAPSLEAQLRPLVHPGNRVRIVEHPGAEPVVRTVFDVRGDTLLVDDGTTSGLHPVHVPDMRRVHVSRGLQRNTGRGVRLGFVAAAPLGALVGANKEQTCDELELCSGFLTRGETMFFHAIGAGALGGVVGAVVGSQSRSERWERLRRGRYPAMAVQADGGVSLAVCLPI